MRRAILADSNELRALSRRVSKAPFDRLYQRLQKRCSMILQSSPITEDQWRTLWSHGTWGAAVSAARTAQGRMLDLLIAHHIDRNTAYRDRAIEELRNLVSWSTWVDPCHNHLPADLCTAEAAVAALVGLDWLWDDLSDTQRQAVLEAVREKAIKPYLLGVRQKAWWYTCYHNWNAVINSGCGLAGLVLSDESPEAAEAHTLALVGLDEFYNALGKEGGWDEGTGYWGYAVRYLLLLAEASNRLGDDQRLLHRRGMDTTGLFPIYFTPNGQAASFGDNPGVPLHGTLYLLVKHFGMKELAWWLDTYAFHSDIRTSDWSAAGLAMLFRPADLAMPADPKLEAVRVFQQIGWAAMADRWPRPNFYVAAKTGDLSANHSQRDMNSVQVQVAGEMLLANLGQVPTGQRRSGEDSDRAYEVQAAAHNTLVVAERDHQIDARGEIVAASEGRNFRWLVCDAGNACGEGVRFIRHVLMPVSEKKHEAHMLIVLDELTNDAPERVDLFWHTPGSIGWAKDGKFGLITGRRSSLHFCLEATVDFDAKSTERKLDTRRTHRVIQVSSGVIGTALFCSVFSTRPISTPPELIRGAHGETELKLGRLSASFTSGKSHLKLEKLNF